jgi:hypothetical protein
MSKSWLKMIYSSESPCPETYEPTHVHFRRGRPRSIHRGDRMVLYACGRERQVFALAEVTGEVYENGQEDWPYQVDIKYTINLPVSKGVPIDEVSTPERDLARSLRQSSYIELTEQEYERAAARLEEAAERSRPARV